MDLAIHFSWTPLFVRCGYFIWRSSAQRSSRRQRQGSLGLCEKHALLGAQETEFGHCQCLGGTGFTMAIITKALNHYLEIIPVMSNPLAFKSSLLLLHDYYTPVMLLSRHTNVDPGPWINNFCWFIAQVIANRSKCDINLLQLISTWCQPESVWWIPADYPIESRCCWKYPEKISPICW